VHPAADFYSTTAQVIPTIVLTYAIERRFTSTDPDRPSFAGLLWVPLSLALLVAGEGAALAGAAGAATVWGARLIVVALGFGSFLIVGYFVIGYAGDSLRDPKMQEHIDRSPLATGCAVPLAMMVAYAVAFLRSWPPSSLRLWRSSQPLGAYKSRCSCLNARGWRAIGVVPVWLGR
jgi:hypothetical protein